MEKRPEFLPAVFPSGLAFNFTNVKMEVLVYQLFLTLCHLMDCSPPGSSVHGISQARITGVGCHFLFQEETLPLACCLSFWFGFFFFFFFNVGSPKQGAWHAECMSQPESTVN